MNSVELKAERNVSEKAPEQDGHQSEPDPPLLIHLPPQLVNVLQSHEPEDRHEEDVDVRGRAERPHQRGEDVVHVVDGVPRLGRLVGLHLAGEVAVDEGDELDREDQVGEVGPGEAAEKDEHVGAEALPPEYPDAEDVAEDADAAQDGEDDVVGRQDRRVLGGAHED